MFSNLANCQVQERLHGESFDDGREFYRRNTVTSSINKLVYDHIQVNPGAAKQASQHVEVVVGRCQFSSVSFVIFHVCQSGHIALCERTGIDSSSIPSRS